jgi:hypothetical protein
LRRHAGAVEEFQDLDGDLAAGADLIAEAGGGHRLPGLPAAMRSAMAIISARVVRRKK